MPLPEGKNCGNCRYYWPPQDGDFLGTCRKYAPKPEHFVRDAESDPDDRTWWPYVKGDQGCWEHAPVVAPNTGPKDPLR